MNVTSLSRSSHLAMAPGMRASFPHLARPTKARRRVLMRGLTRQLMLSAVLGLVFGAASPAGATLMTITPGDLAGATLIDFGPTQTGAPINGQSINGVTFRYRIGGLPSTDAIIDGGPGNTNNITVANVTNF